jgi:hypothetical protein
MPEAAQRLAALCREIAGGDLRAIAAEIDAEPLLDRIIAALAGGADAATLRPALDQLDAGLVVYGVPGGLVPPAWRNYAQPRGGGRPLPRDRGVGLPGGALHALASHRPRRSQDPRLRRGRDAPGSRGSSAVDHVPHSRMTATLSHQDPVRNL